MLDELLDGHYPPALTDLQDCHEPLDHNQLKDLRHTLKDLPFAHRIIDAIQKDLQTERRNFARHNHEVYHQITAIKDNARELGLDREIDDHTLKSLRLAAFLHDIGKALEQSRHPTLGWHVLDDLASVGGADLRSRNALLAALKRHFDNSQDAFRKLALLVRDHDKFGVVSTGEASLVILGGLVQVTSGGAGRSWDQFRNTWLLTLADIGGTRSTQSRPDPEVDELRKNLVLRDDKRVTLCSDWRRVQGLFTGTTSYQAIVSALKQHSETPEATVERVLRLLRERAGDWGPDLRAAFTEDKVWSAIETHFGPRDLPEFCSDFGMVAKLDYALQFWNELANYLTAGLILHGSHAGHEITHGLWQIEAGPKRDELLQAAEYQQEDAAAWVGRVAEALNDKNDSLRDLVRGVLQPHAREMVDDIAEKQAELLITILKRIVGAYQGLIRGDHVRARAPIGVGFGYLRTGDREKKFALYELLSGQQRQRGLRWLIDEIASWEMLA